MAYFAEALCRLKLQRFQDAASGAQLAGIGAKRMEVQILRLKDGN